MNTVDKLFGLELADGCLLLLVFFIAFMLNREGLFLNAGIIAAAYAGLRAVKKGKPDGYLLIALKYLLSSRFKRVSSTQEAEAPLRRGKP
ncbi:MAG: hypothetical protein WCU88_09830 [Elusimicrobiota bacterium]